MPITVDWTSKEVYVPKADLNPGLVSGTFYRLDTNWFKNQLRALEASVYGIVNTRIVDHSTQYTVAGVTYARKVEIVNTYSVTFEDGQYSVELTGSNNNIWDIENLVLNQNQVQVIPTNSAGLIVGQTSISDSDRLAIANEVWDTLYAEYSAEGSYGQLVQDLLKLTKNKVTKSGDIITIFEIDGVTPWKQYDLSNGGRVQI
jgi:hypothetical protein